MKKYDYFNVEIDKNIDKELANLLEKQPYTNEEEIGELFSHLAHIDKVQQEKNINDGKIQNKFIQLKLCYPNPENNKGELETLKIPLGQGHFTKGLNHLREIGRIELEKSLDTKKEFFKKLSERYDKYLRMPTKIGIDILQKSGWGTMENCAKIMDIAPSPELQEFLKGLNQNTTIQENLREKEENKI
ncbi:hypothetical protein OQH60_07960 [Campylobacter sp. MIT 21-1685]|uniref:hypothetical protein n=1 Tax=unclassified Campylobacter TaxID=2593542 RepID=UPI00224B73E3|nr:MULTISPECIES: hypothetical protein [unclassified Campylobacter]MCX2683801.1 hypothetical protein [Campylobacter sp. MIT 21-1684]MCX2752085.1 hypothetical protein [Campylobacter sp. MIT 21-1682]MCX2808272.1 hypothetical protein [Campylobacter sp. MIT 21-1685]